MRKSHMIGALVAGVAALAISVSAMAYSQKASFDIEGFLGYIGISQDALNPTAVDSKFNFEHDGQLESVVIKTRNEMVKGALGALQNCDGHGCEGLAAALNGAHLTSLHDSKVELTVTEVGYRSYSLPTPYGDLPLLAEVVSGDIEGKLKGRVWVPTSQGLLYGKTDLDIEGAATYACFSPFLSDIGVTEALPGMLYPCEDGQGEFLPIELNVVDTGDIEIKKQIVEGDKGKRLIRSAVKLDGELTVHVGTDIDLDLLVRGDASAFAVAGGLQITDAAGELELH